MTVFIKIVTQLMLSIVTVGPNPLPLAVGAHGVSMHPIALLAKESEVHFFTLDIVIRSC
jgi:hypothetical protein